MNPMLPRPRFWAETAEQSRLRLSLFGETMIFMLLYLLSALAQTLVLSVPMSAWLLSTQSQSLFSAISAGSSAQSALQPILEQVPDWMNLVSLFASCMMIVLALVYARRFQKRSAASLGLRGAGAAGEYLLGLVVGLVLALAGLGIGAAAGGFSLASEGPRTEGLPLLLLALLGCGVQGFALELLQRGVYAPSVGARCPVGLALALSSVVPAVLESGGALFSVSVLNALLFAVFLGIWVIKRGRLWSACAIHAAWGFAFSYLFDFSAAGAHGGIRLLDVDLDLFRPLLSGGEEGPQASLGVTVILLAAIGAALALKAADPAAPQAPMNEQAANNL